MSGEDSPAWAWPTGPALAYTPSPPPSGFLNTILNPDAPNNPLPPPLSDDALMAHRRSSRLPNGYVDLTSEPETPRSPEPPRPRKRQTPTPGPSAKRLKRSDGAHAKRDAKPESKIGEIDLSDDRADIQEILQKQRAEAVQAQKKPEEEATTFNTFTCVICMDTPTDITATSCGHLFCHSCLMEALIAGENRSGAGEPKRSQCPVCRKFINRNKAADVIPLLLMKKGLATQPRKKTSPPSGKVT